MASIFVHASIGILGYVFTGIDPAVLTVASLFADIEYFPMALISFARTKSLVKATAAIAHTGILHSILGNIFICFPLLYFGFSVYGYNGAVLVNSILLGLISHIMLDIPAHPALMIFWPFKVYEKNPLLLKLATPRLERIYPYRKFEKAAYQYMAEFQWTLVSMVIPLLLLILIFALT